MIAPNVRPWLAPGGFPYQTRRYQRKLRILAINDCTGSCWFCHNEGMPKRSGAVLEPRAITKVLPVVGELTQFRAVISGGEPLLSPHLSELLDVLETEGFDVTLIASEAGIHRLEEFAPSVAGIHVSVRLRDYLKNEASSRLLTVLRLLRRSNQGIRLTLNTTVERPDVTVVALARMLETSEELGANLKLLGLFEGTSAVRRVPTRWIERWRIFVDELESMGFHFLSADGRTVRFFNDASRYVDLSDISCVGAADHLGDGRCFDAMDVTIDPSGRVRLCRWQGNGFPVQELVTQSDLLQALSSLKTADVTGCPFALSQASAAHLPMEFEPHQKWPLISAQQEEGVRRQIRNRSISYFGREGVVARLENEFARAVGSCDAFAVASGTVAVYLACEALELTNGAEVVVPAITYPGVVAALLHRGARLRVCDVDPLTGNLDPASLQRALTPKTRGVVVTHLWGVPAAMTEIVDICRPRGVKVIEDASHAFGASTGGTHAGSVGDAGCFSLQANKIVFAGEGGMVVAQDRRVFERIVALAAIGPRFHDSVRRPDLSPFELTGTALKLKIHPLGAALALRSLREARSIIAARAERMELLTTLLKRVAGVIPPPRVSESGRVYYAYRMLLDSALRDHRAEFADLALRNGLDIRLPDWDLVPEMKIAHQSAAMTVTSVVEARALQSAMIGIPTWTAEPLELVQYYASTLAAVANEVWERESNARVAAGGE